MRGTLFFGALLLLCSVICSDGEGQSIGPISLSGTQCLSVSATSRATAAFQVTGSWSGTIQPQIALAGQGAVNTTAAPSTSATPASTVTANGAYYSNVSGMTTYILCGATITGTAKIWINLSEKVH